MGEKERWQGNGREGKVGGWGWERGNREGGGWDGREGKVT